MAVNQIADLKEQVNWHWRNTMRPIRFFNFDSRAIIPWFIVLFHIRVSTIIFCVIMTIIFQILEKKGLTFDAALRSLRPIFFGPYRPGVAKFRYRTLKDFGR